MIVPVLISRMSTLSGISTTLTANSILQAKGPGGTVTLTADSLSAVHVAVSDFTQTVAVPVSAARLSAALVDTAGHAYESIQDAAGNYHLSVGMVQDVIADSLNSTSPSATLASGATWTGSASDTLGVAGLQVSLSGTLPYTVYVDQSPDGTSWDVIDTYKYYPTKSFGVTVQAVNSYYRVRVTNGTTASGIIRLQSCLCPVVEALPRSLDVDQRLKTGTAITDAYGWEAECTPFNELRTIEPVRLVGTIFDGTATSADTNFWTTTLASGASAGTANSQLTLRTNTTANASADVQSVRYARYVAANANMFRGVIQQDAAVANNTRRWGAFSTTDGAYYCLSGTTAYLGTRKGGVNTMVANGSFNGDYGPTLYGLGANAQTYEIYWTQRYVWFVLDGVILHTVTASSTTWADTLTLPVRLENYNTGNSSSDVTMNIRVATIHRLGSLITDPQKAYIHGAVTNQILKRGPGKLHRLVFNASANGSTYTLYDATSAASVFASGAFGSQAAPCSVEFMAPFYTGLTITTVNAGTDVTVIYE